MSDVRMADSMVKMGDRIRRLRERRGMTQVFLAGMLEMSAVSLSRIECGHSSPSLQTMIGIAEAFGVSLDFLAGRARPRKRTAGRQ